MQIYVVDILKYLCKWGAKTFAQHCMVYVICSDYVLLLLLTKLATALITESRYHARMLSLNQKFLKSNCYIINPWVFSS